MNFLKKFITIIKLRINGIHVSFSATFSASKFSVGNYIGSRCVLYSVDLGKYSYVNNECCIDNTSIGNFSCIGRGVMIGLGQHPVDRVFFHRMFYSSNIKIWRNYFFNNNFHEVKKTKIGSDVWIGAGSIIMDGVEIGDGTLVAAGSVVTKNLDEYSIYAGVPAKKIRNRFRDNIVRDYIKSIGIANKKDDGYILNLAKTGFFNESESDFESAQNFIKYLEGKRLSLEANSVASN